MFAVDQIIHITEVPTWILAPFVVGLALTLALTVRWILAPPKE